MAETIYCRDGTCEVVLVNDKSVFLERLLLDRVGEDASDYFANYMKELRSDIDSLGDAREEAEKIADNYLAVLNDTLEELEALKKLVFSQRLDWKKLQKGFVNVYNKLHKNL